MIIGISLILIFGLISFYMLIISPKVEVRKETESNEKILSSIQTEFIDGTEITFYTYPYKKLIDIKGENVEIDNIPVIDLKNECKLDTMILKNVEKILNFNVEVKNLIIENSKYYFKDNAIFDDKHNIVFIVNRPTKKDLIYYAENYSISSNLINMFSDATYVQYSPKKNSIRISKPFDENKENAWVVIPNKINHFPVEVFEYNFSILDFVYISENLNIVRAEKESKFRKLLISKLNKRIRVRHKCLFYRFSKEYIKYQNTPISSTSLKEIPSSYKPKYKFVRSMYFNR